MGTRRAPDPGQEWAARTSSPFISPPACQARLGIHKAKLWSWGRVGPRTGPLPAGHSQRLKVPQTGAARSPHCVWQSPSAWRPRPSATPHNTGDTCRVRPLPKTFKAPSCFLGGQGQPHKQLVPHCQRQMEQLTKTHPDHSLIQQDVTREKETLRILSPSLVAFGTAMKLLPGTLALNPGVSGSNPSYSTSNPASC